MKQIFVPPSDGGYATHLRARAQELGCTVGFMRSPYVVAFTDAGAYSAPWIVAGGLDALGSRLNNQRLQHAMPAVSADNLSMLGEGPVFIKPDCTYRDRLGSAAYKEYPSLVAAEAALAVMSASLRSKLVAQPSIGVPSDVLEVEVSISPQGEAYVFHCSIGYEWVGFNAIRKLESVPIPSEVYPALQEAVSAYGICGGMHSVQFVQYQGAWRLLDWNPRLTARFDSGFLDDGPVFTTALQHMLEMPHTKLQAPYTQHRNYRNQPVSAEAVQAARDMGFRLRLHHRTSLNKGLDALVWFGDKQTADAKFAEFEELL